MKFYFLWNVLYQVKNKKLDFSHTFSVSYSLPPTKCYEPRGKGFVTWKSLPSKNSTKTCEASEKSVKSLFCHQLIRSSVTQDWIFLFARFHQNQKIFRGNISQSILAHRNKAGWVLVSLSFFLCRWFQFTYPKQKFCEICLHEVKCCSSASWKVAAYHLLIESREQTYFFLFGFSCTEFLFL